jgi:ribose 5-phosphate isomerase A
VVTGADWQEQQKIQAARHAAELVEDGMLLGLGSGTTAEHFLRALAPRIDDGLRVRGVATSGRTERVASEVGIWLAELEGPVDLAIDGADAIERGTLNVIKGRGGALTREKLVALAARRFVVVGDASKSVERLADTQPDLAVPIEVLPFGWKMTRSRLAALGNPVLRERGGGPFVTDNGNLVVDLFAAALEDPVALGETIARVPGVIEHGLFLGIAVLAVVAGDDGIEELVRA